MNKIESTPKKRKPYPKWSLIVMATAIPLWAFYMIGGFSEDGYDKSKIWLVFVGPVYAMIMYWISSNAKETPEYKKEKIIIDKEREIIELRNVTFQTQFKGNKVTPISKLRFEDIYRFSTTTAHGGTKLIDLWTVKGKVTLYNLEDFKELKVFFRELVNHNTMTLPDLRERIAAMPKVKTAFYGWVILFGALASIAYIIYLQIKIDL